jgi:hypothetical protein
VRLWKIITTAIMTLLRAAVDHLSNSDQLHVHFTKLLSLPLQQLSFLS